MLYALVLDLYLPQNFCHTHTVADRQKDRKTGRHFPKIVKSCSGYPKTYKYIKNRKSKFCMKEILSSFYIKKVKSDVMIF